MAEDGKDNITKASTLPEFRGMNDEVVKFRNSIEIFDKTRRNHERLGYNAELPQIIGYVPLQEREFFSQFTPKIGSLYSGIMIGPGDEDFQLLIENMPRVYELITDDISGLNIEGLKLDTVVIDRRFTNVGKTPRPIKTWHIDPDLAYLISDQKPTEFYQGPAQLMSTSSGGLTLDTQSLIPDIIPIEAPSFAIVRQGPLTIHRSPIFTHRTNRTFMDFLTDRES